MNGNVVGAIITSVTTVVTVVYTNRLQLRRQTRQFEQVTAAQTEAITAHVTDTLPGPSSEQGERT